MEERFFINSRYLKGHKINAPMYINHNGVIKRYIPSPLAKKDAIKSGTWCLLEDLPNQLQVLLEDMAISEKDLQEYFRVSASKKGAKSSTYASNENVKLHITESTLLLPIVDNFLPYDGINAYTVTEKNGKPQLTALVVNWVFHWSELYTGQTKYGNNVFCLAQDLPKDVQEKYADCFIPLSDALAYLTPEPHEESKKI